MAKRLPLLVILLLYAVMSVAGINWGLPSRDVDRYLFGDGEAWSGEKIHELSGAAHKASDTRGADVDADPIVKSSSPVSLTNAQEEVAGIYLRYRLFTHQPDEMITMMALAKMQPGAFDFDPQLYQYGGLFIYPVGALIKACGVFGLFEVRADLPYYLDHPDEFGKFYVVARAYTVTWGLVGVMVVYLIGRRLRDRPTGLMAALLYTLLPVVVCMSHEAKPHLPGAVLMLLAVLAAMRYAQSNRLRDWWLLCIACGAALGTVLSSLPIFLLIPLVELVRVYRDRCSLWAAVRRAAAGAGVALIAYAMTNPYVPINLVANPEVLRSNLSNSMAMYEIDRIGEGLLRMLALTLEGATLPALLLGAFGVAWLVWTRHTGALMLLAPAGVFFVQFVLIGAGKPAEYGRFGVFTDITLAVAAAWLLMQWRPGRGGPAQAAPPVLLGLWVAVYGFSYLYDFVADSGPASTRLAAAEVLADDNCPLAVLAEPAPYSMPPVNFARREVWLFQTAEQWRQGLHQAATRTGQGYPDVLVRTTDEAERWWPRPTPISWANRPVRIQGRPQAPANNL